MSSGFHIQLFHAMKLAFVSNCLQCTQKKILIAALQLLQKSESDLALFETPKLTKFEYFIEVCCTLQFIHTSFLYGVAPEDKDEKMLNCRCEMIQILDEREARGFFSSELKNCT